jgi:hypothetical protein
LIHLVLKVVGAVVAGAGRGELEALNGEGKVLVISVIDQEAVVDGLLEALGLIAFRDERAGRTGCCAVLDASSLAEGLVVGLDIVHNNPPLAKNIDGATGLDVLDVGRAEVGLLDNVLQAVDGVLSVSKDILVQLLDRVIVVLNGLLNLIGGVLGVLKTIRLGVAVGTLGWGIVGIMGSIMGIMGSAMGGAMRSAMRSGVLGIRRGVVRGWVSVDRSRGVGRLMVRGRGVSVRGRGRGVGSRDIRRRGVRGLMVRRRGGVMRSIRRMGSWVRGTEVGVSLRLSVGQGDRNDGGDNQPKLHLVSVGICSFLEQWKTFCKLAGTTKVQQPHTLPKKAKHEALSGFR